MTTAVITIDDAVRLDAEDPLARFRDEFVFPRTQPTNTQPTNTQPPDQPAAAETDGRSPDSGAGVQRQIYFDGNSLGLMSKQAKSRVEGELERWGRLGVTGHFTGETAWMPYHELLTDPMAAVVGCLPEEVVVMNTLTVNLHMLMISFYTPDSTRHKILIEDHAFPSDHFAVESQIRQRGFDPATSLVTVGPRPGAHTLEQDDILEAIERHGDELALILLPGVHYYTGEVLPMAEITRAGHAVGARVGFDLAHAAGNIPLDLHDWGVDFAAWCTYKYLNSGPGGPGGCFIHNRHVASPDLPKLTGWWGTNKATRFRMGNEFDPIPTAESWQVSNPPVLAMAGLLGAMEVLDEAGGVHRLRAKSEAQITFLDRLLDSVIGDRIENLTPRPLDRRGCQSSLRVTNPAQDGEAAFEALTEAGVTCDWRHPDVIRVAPVPLYNSFSDIYRFVEILDGLLI